MHNGTVTFYIHATNKVKLQSVGLPLCDVG